MIRKKGFGVVMAFCVFACSGLVLRAVAGDVSSGLADGLAVSGRLGTLGAGVEASLGSFGPFVVRAGGNYLPLSFNGKINDLSSATWLKRRRPSRTKLINTGFIR